MLLDCVINPSSAPTESRLLCTCTCVCVCVHLQLVMFFHGVSIFLGQFQVREIFSCMYLRLNVIVVYGPISQSVPRSWSVGGG